MNKSGIRVLSEKWNELIPIPSRVRLRLSVWESNVIRIESKFMYFKPKANPMKNGLSSPRPKKLI